MIQVRRKAPSAPAEPAGATALPDGFLAEPAPILQAAPEHEFEPVPGLPEELPEGERVLWRGAPDWKVMARRALLARTVAYYFAALMALRALVGWSDGLSALEILSGVTALLPLALASVALLAGIAYVVAKTTLYTITNRRVVMRIGVALQLTLNVPFAKIASAAVARYPGGAGEISLALLGKDRFAYLLLWPHARPWRFGKPEPSLRCLGDIAEPARILSEALAAHHAAQAAETPALATAEPEEATSPARPAPSVAARPRPAAPPAGAAAARA